MYKEILLYTAAWCGDCRRAKMWLDEYKIPYKSIDIENDPEASQELVSKTGKKGIPYLVLDGEWVRAYTPGVGVEYAAYKKIFKEYITS